VAYKPMKKKGFFISGDFGHSIFSPAVSTDSSQYQRLRVALENSDVILEVTVFRNDSCINAACNGEF